MAREEHDIQEYQVGATCFHKERMSFRNNCVYGSYSADEIHNIDLRSVAVHDNKDVRKYLHNIRLVYIGETAGLEEIYMLCGMHTYSLTSKSFF